MNDIEYFADLLLCVHNIYLWTYDEKGTLLSSNCPEEEMINPVFFHQHNLKAKEFVMKHDKPTLFNSSYQTMWMIDSKKKDGMMENFYTIGPFYIDSFPKAAIEAELDSTSVSLEYKENRMKALKTLPVISFTKIMEYMTMMHYALTKERIFIYDLHFSKPLIENPAEENGEEIMIHGTYEAEQEMLRMVSEGDLRIIDQIRKISSMSDVGKLANEDSEPLRQLKNTILVAIVLFSRAAIAGGLYPETALTLTDRYFQATEASQTFHELQDIAITMQTDFVNRVHKIRHSENGYSKAVQTITDYIQLHLEEEILLSDIAKEMGYSDYYLSKKFKKETGKTIKEYIRDARLQRAAFLLKTGRHSIQDISQQLHFSSFSYFIECFKQKYGMTPGEYRTNL